MSQLLSEISTFIGNVGFPVFVSVWLLIQNREMIAALNRNTIAIETIKDRMEVAKQ